MSAAPAQSAGDEWQQLGPLEEEPGVPNSQRDVSDRGDGVGPGTSAPSKLRPRLLNGFVAPTAPARAAPQPSAGAMPETRPDTTGATAKATEDDDVSSDSVSGSVPERNLTEEQQQEQRQELRNNYDFYVVLDCLEVFEEEIDLSEDLSVQRLEDQIITSVGTESNLLAHIHLAVQRLLLGISPHSKVQSANWHAYVVRRLAQYYDLDPQDNPLAGTEKGDEAAAYAALSAQTRCVVLRALCDLRCERDDARNVMALAQKNEKEQLKALGNGAEAPSDTDIMEPEDFNKAPWGEDADENFYWLHDLGKGRGMRLCREAPPAEPAAPAKESGSKKGTKRPRSDIVGGSWETIACDIDAIGEVAEELRKSKRRADSDLGKALEAELIEPWREAEAERKRKEEAAALKEAQKLAAIEAGKSRSLRQRKPVDYTFSSDIDDVLKQMMRGDVPRDDTPELTHASAASSEPAANAPQQQAPQQQQRQQRMQPGQHHAAPPARELPAADAQPTSRRRGRPPAAQPPPPAVDRASLQTSEWEAPFAAPAPAPAYRGHAPAQARAQHKHLHAPLQPAHPGIAPFAPLDTYMWPEVQNGAQLSYRRQPPAQPSHRLGHQPPHISHQQPRNGYVADYPHQGRHGHHLHGAYGPAPIPTGQQNIMENNHVRRAPSNNNGYQIEKLTAEQLLNGFEQRQPGVGRGVVW